MMKVHIIMARTTDRLAEAAFRVMILQSPRAVSSAKRSWSVASASGSEDELCLDGSHGIARSVFSAAS